MRRWAIVNTLLGIIVALVGIEIVRTWARGLATGAPPESAAASTSTPAPEARAKGKRGRADKASAPVQQTPALLVTAIAEKDLFDPSRQPPIPEEMTPASAPVTKPPDNMMVVGVRILGKDREVFVSDGTQGAAITRRLRAGDQIAGYTVKAIDPIAVTLTTPSGDVVSMPLSLDHGKAQPGAPRPPTPGRPPQPAGAAQMASPAAGMPGFSPAAGVGARLPVPVPAAAAPAPGSPQPVVGQPLPSGMRKKIGQLKQNDKRPGRER